MTLFRWLAACLISATAFAQDPANPSDRPRVRDLGIKVGILPPGRLNAITDVAGVQVGHHTLVKGSDVRTGVTVIEPHLGNIFQNKVPAAIVVGNGFGKLIGVTQVQELGLLETPIGLTNTMSAFSVADALVGYTISQPGNEDVRSVNPVVGECNDGWLNDIRGRHITSRHVISALNDATSGVVKEGSVGAGTGTRCMGFKGGIGTSSRVVPQELGGYTVGVLAQTNFNGVLDVAGAPVGRELDQHFLRDSIERSTSPEHGSCMFVLATDAPLDARQLRRLATRVLLGLAAVGSPMTHGSGDYVIAFTTNKSLRVAYQSSQPVKSRRVLRDEALSPLFQATREATEEAILNSLFKATTVTGRDGHTSIALPIVIVIEICKKYGVIQE